MTPWDGPPLEEYTTPAERETDELLDRATEQKAALDAAPRWRLLLRWRLEREWMSTVNRIQSNEIARGVRGEVTHNHPAGTVCGETCPAREVDTPCDQPSCARTRPCDAEQSGWCAHPHARDGL